MSTQQILNNINMGKEIIKEYKNGDLTIVWKPSLCIHAAECVKALPNVYNPKAKPWIVMENASTEELIDQIKKCPSGALSSYSNNAKPQKENIMETKVDVLENGPLLVHGRCMVKNIDGQVEEKDKVTAFCRCGASEKKPYCDGAHKKNEFKG